MILATRIPSKRLFFLCFLLSVCTEAYCAPAQGAERRQTPFQRTDADGDGKLSRAEFRGPDRAFTEMDKNGDGYLTPDELRANTGSKASAKQRTPDPNLPMPVLQPAVPTSGLQYIDTHNHLAGWCGGGSDSDTGYERAAQVALATMDKLGITKMLIMPTPQTINQDNMHEVSDLMAAAKRHQDRFALLGGGGTLNVMVQQAIAEGKTSEKLRAKFKQTAKEIISQGVVGFGEMAAEHLSMNQQHPYVSAPPDHPLFLLLADLAAEYDVPIDIHMEAVPQDMPLPARLGAMPNNPKTLRANIPALERLLAHNSKARILWAHAGWDNTGCRTTDLSDRLMGTFTNLYLSIRVVQHNVPGRPVDEQGTIKPEWKALILKYPDRFLIGSDEFYLPQDKGQGHPSTGSAAATIAFLSQLPEGVAKMVGYENAIRFFKLDRER